MKTGKMILLLGSVLGVFTILAGCDRVDTSDPNATPKPTATVTTSPSADAIDITDDFGDKTSGWGSKKETNYSYGYSDDDDVYTMHSTGGTTKYIAVPFEPKLLDADKGYTIEVDVTNSTTENASVGGLFINSNLNSASISTESDGGVFVIDPKNQKYALQNSWSKLTWLAPTPKENNEVIEIYPNKTNTLKIEVSGTKVTRCWINKTELRISDISLKQHLGEYVGLYFSSNEDTKKDFTMTYDNFVLKGTKYR